MTTHECGCSFFGPGPHPVDARHRNARGCEHAEQGLLISGLRERIEGLYIRGFETPLLRLKDDAYNAALDDVLALLGAAQEKGEAGS